MHKNWTKYTFVCDPDECDTMIEVTVGPFNWPSGVVNLTCPCGRNMQYVSVEDATITPINERNKMETAPYTYNPNSLVTVKKIVDGEATYETIKVVDLEGMLFVNPTIDVVESHTDGTHTTHMMKRTDIMEMFRLRGFDKARLESQEKQIGRIIDNLSEDSWFNPNTEKEEILNDLCEILDYQPKKEISFEGTIYFSGRIDVPLAEYEDFDIEDYVSDISLDVYNGDVVVDEFHLEDVREA